ncbi:MAG TPA: serine/threonine protein kinase [Polyangiaceae bacterium]|nr:serine/threonine protein kinase [Polyangiaceae bacterium]
MSAPLRPSPRAAARAPAAAFGRPPGALAAVGPLTRALGAALGRAPRALAPALGRPPRALAAAAALALGLGAAGCGRPFDIKTPPGFVELEEDRLDYDYRASSATGVVSALRVIDTKGKGDLAFWTNVVNTRVREELGYAPFGESGLGEGGGAKGRLLRFGYEQGGRVYLYEIALFVGRKHLYVLEAGGRKDLFERQAEALAWQRRTFKPK